MPIETSYVAELRRAIMDVRASRRAISFGVKDTGVTRCIAEITRGHLIISPFGGTAPQLDLDLSSSRYDTIGGLYQALARATGYTAQLDQDANQDHASIDIEQFGPVDCLGTGVEMVHHLFADGELDTVIQRALTRHNPSLTLQTMPPQEWVFVLPLAQAGILRTQAVDASKRRGLDKDVQTLLQLADSFEAQYAADTQRLARALQSPREANSNIVDEGDVMLGSLSRTSLRTGYQSPIAKALPPDAAIMLDPDERDVEDDNARLVWQRNKNVEFYSYELWMDFQPEVTREREGGLAYGGHVAPATAEDSRSFAAHRTTSSTLVTRTVGANANTARSSFVETAGQLGHSFAVGALESETTYYFRLFVIGSNLQCVGSQVIKVITKALRARFSPQSYTDKTSGPAGTVVTITLDPLKGAISAQHEFRLGEKACAITILGAYSFSFVVPTFQNKGVAKDFILTSPTKLVDVRRQVFTVTA